MNRMTETEDILLALKAKYVIHGKRYKVPFTSDPIFYEDHFSISNIDRESFDVVMEILNEIHDIIKEHNYISDDNKDYVTAHIINSAAKISSIWGLKFLVKSKATLINLCRGVFNKLDHEIFCDDLRIYDDYLFMVDESGAEDRYKPYFDERHELREMHDSVSSYIRIKNDEITSAKLKKAITRVEKFKYGNADYVVISPSCPNEFLKEGEELHHCVGSYLKKVIKGDTNIMFIRRNRELDKPFFTVEISDEGIIEQIHGSYNRNLSTEPDLVPFIDEWEKNRKVKVHGIDKIR